jgi:hypothetical protein
MDLNSCGEVRASISADQVKVGAEHANSSSAVFVFSITSMLRVTVRALLLFHTVVAINISPVDLASGKLIR